MSSVSSNVAGTIEVVAPTAKAKVVKSTTPKVAKDKPIVKSTSKGKGQKVAKVAKAKTPAKPTSKVKALAKSTTKSAKDRRNSFFLNDEQITEYKAEYKETKTLPIPYNSGAYRSFLLALLTLGADKAHPFAKVKEKMREIMSDPDTKVDGKTQWQRFINKPGASDIEDNCLGVDGKIHQNADTLQRTNDASNTPYGMKLLQMGKVLKSKGVVVDILKSKDGKEKTYRLNTNANAPTNEWKRQRAE